MTVHPAPTVEARLRSIELLAAGSLQPAAAQGITSQK